MSQYLIGNSGSVTLVLTKANFAGGYSGTFTISGGGTEEGGGITSVEIGSTAITSGNVAYNTTLAQTATDLINNIIAHGVATASVQSQDEESVTILVSSTDAATDGQSIRVTANGDMAGTNGTMSGGEAQTSRTLQYSGFIVGEDKIAINQFTTDSNFDSEREELPPFQEGFAYDINTLITSFSDKDYNMVLFSGDEGFSRVINGNFNATIGWRLSWSQLDNSFKFVVLSDSTDYNLDGALQEITVTFKDPFGNVMIKRQNKLSLPAEITFDVEQAKTFYQNKSRYVEMIVVVRSTIGDYSEFAVVDDNAIDFALMVDDGRTLSGNNAVWT